MIPIEQKINQTFNDVEFPRQRVQIPSVTYLLPQIDDNMIKHRETSKKRSISNIELNLHESHNSKLNKQQIKRKIKQNLIVAEFLSHQKPLRKLTEQQQFQQQQFPITEPTTSIKLSKAQQKIRKYLLQKYQKRGKISQSDTQFLKQTCSQKQLEKSQIYQSKYKQSMQFFQTPSKTIIQSKQESSSYSKSNSSRYQNNPIQNQTSTINEK